MRANRESEIYSIKASAFTAWRVETKIGQIVGQKESIDYKEYLNAFGLLTPEEIEALQEFKQWEALRVKRESEQKTAQVMSWVYSKNYVEEV